MAQKVPETPLPPPGFGDEEAHTAMSQRFLEHADIEIEKGDRLQASEKVWASVAHALKVVAEQRGWQHDSHSKLADVARQLGTESAEATSRSRKTRERRATAFSNHFMIAASMHSNIYENGLDWPYIEGALADAQVFIGKLDAFRDKPPGAFTIRNYADQRRVGRLLGINPRGREEERQRILDRLLPVRTRSDAGFSPKFGYRLPESDGPDGNEDGNESE